MIGFLILVSCTQHQTAPISSRQPPTVTQVKTHIVKVGETLYSIAWQYNLDYRYLASINGVGSDFLIYPGQRLALKSSQQLPLKKPLQAKPQVAAKPALRPSPKASPVVKTPSPTDKKRSNKTPVTIPEKIAKTNVLTQSSWQWPARGKVVTNFYSSSASGKGIDIAGKKGESILAAADGKIVYAGNGIRGYGNLVIIRHNAQYLSAYAHNDKINVKEGEQVTGGQRIAELGSTGVGAKNRTILHFQVRKNGKPIDPMSVLPKRNF